MSMEYDSRNYLVQIIIWEEMIYKIRWMYKKNNKGNKSLKILRCTNIV